MAHKVVTAGLLRIAAVMIAALIPSASQGQELAWRTTALAPNIKAAPPAPKVQAPPGFLAACSRYAWLCSDQPAQAAGIADERIRAMAVSVNDEVNRTVRQATDHEIHGVAELWSLPARGRGDCEDVALAKMYQLLNRGVPADRLSLAIGLDRRGDNHAVLLVRTNSGYLLLDSLTDRIVRLEQTRYRMLAMQAADDRSSWQSIESGMTAHIAASAATSPASAEVRRSFLAERMPPDR